MLNRAIDTLHLKVALRHYSDSSNRSTAFNDSCYGSREFLVDNAAEAAQKGNVARTAAYARYIPTEGAMYLLSEALRHRAECTEVVREHMGGVFPSSPDQDLKRADYWKQKSAKYTPKTVVSF